VCFRRDVAAARAALRERVPLVDRGQD